MTEFGFRVPDFPVDGSTGPAFVDQFVETLHILNRQFKSAWVADHFIPWANFQDQTTDTYECWTTLCYLAGLFKDYTFGSIVMSQSYRNPALIAKMAATLQALTGGRFVLGIGAGWKQDEYAAYGFEFPEPAARIHQLEEAVQIIRLMHTQTRASFAGKHYHITDAICEPKPQPAPLKPLLMFVAWLVPLPYSCQAGESVCLVPASSSPPDLPRIWQFSQRTALPPRAPSIVS